MCMDAILYLSHPVRLTSVIIASLSARLVTFPSNMTLK